MKKKNLKKSTKQKINSPKALGEDHYEYLHGYSSTEQKRLFEQAQFYEQSVYEDIDWPKGALQILEPGCGVGAQSDILMRRFPQLNLSCVDRSPEQLKTAQKYHQKNMKQGRVKFYKGEATELPLGESSHDGAFVCYLLEHVPKPAEVLAEIHRVLKPGAKIYCTEVFNAAFYLAPYAPATLKYYFEFNDHQWETGGNPFMGAHLGSLLSDAGFKQIQTKMIYFQLDKRTPKQRTEHCNFFLKLLESASPELLKTKRVTPSLIKEVKNEWVKAANDPDSILFYSMIQASAVAL